jgi:hypothetical protein
MRTLESYALYLAECDNLDVYDTFSRVVNTGTHHVNLL